MICEQLGCSPSELYEKHPGLTNADVRFMMEYGFNKMARQQKMQAEMLAKMFGGK